MTMLTATEAAPAAPADAVAAPAAAPAPVLDAAGQPVAAAPPADTPEAIAAAAAAVKTPEQIAAAEADALAAAGAPETYADFTAPEGAEQLDAGVVTAFTEAARELNLPQKAAQQLIDKMAPIMDARRAEQMEAQRTAWADAVKVDKEFGGAKLEASTVLCARAMDQFATPELRTMLNETGLGNHPELVRFMVKAGQALSEDRIVTGGIAASTGIRSAADTLYPASSVKK